MSEEESSSGDFVIILSSELIAKVMNQYFNAEMFKMEVEVADLQPTEDGYAFTLGFVSKKESNIIPAAVYGTEDAAYIIDEMMKRQSETPEKPRKHNKRGKKGTFIAEKEYEDMLHVQNYDDGKDI